MTNIKAKGFDSPAQLREHMAELDEDLNKKTLSKHPERTPEHEIALLKQQLTNLKGRLDLISEQTEGMDRPTHGLRRNPWVKIAATAATTFILGRLVQRLRLGAPAQQPSR